MEGCQLLAFRSRSPRTQLAILISLLRNTWPLPIERDLEGKEDEENLHNF